jgi:hypothetical protein
MCSASEEPYEPVGIKLNVSMWLADILTGNSEELQGLKIL